MIFMFHRIFSQINKSSTNAYMDRGTAISMKKFIEILNFIKSFDYKVLVFSEYVDRIHLEKNSRKYICLTFDDGYIDNYELAFPILQEFGYKATFFPIIDFCFYRKISYLDFYYQTIDASSLKPAERIDYIIGKKKQDFLNKNEQEAKNYLSLLQASQNIALTYSDIYMNESQLKEIYKYGNEIGSHSITHRILTNLEAKEIEEELQGSKKVLQELTNSTCIPLCYPHGKYNSLVIEFVKKCGYHSACTVQVNSKEGRWAIPRVFIREETNLQELFSI